MTSEITITLRTNNGIIRDASKLAAAQALSVQYGGVAEISFIDSDGDEHNIVTAYARHRAHGGIQPAHVNWASTSAEFGTADARVFAAAVTLAAEVAELADLIARQQEAAKGT